jgi:hypothetical protein
VTSRAIGFQASFSSIITRLAVCTATAGLCVVTGIATTFTASQVRLWFASLALVLFPAFLTIFSTSAVFAGFTLIFSQVFEGFEFNAHFFTLSIGVTCLVAFLIVRLPQASSVLLKAKSVRWLRLAMVVFVLSHFITLQHEIPSVATRAVITASGFAGFWVAGLLSGSAHERKGLALGAICVVLMFAVLAVLAYVGLLPLPFAVSAKRTLLGIRSPIERVGVLGFTALGVILPLGVPWLMSVLFRGKNASERVAAFFGVVAIFAASLLIFQARSMVVEIGVALGLSFVLFRPSLTMGALVSGAFLVGLVVVLPQLINADKISSDVRGESYTASFNLIRERPSILILGSNQADTLTRVQDESKFGSLVPNAPVHNIFIMETLSTGLLTSVSLALLFLIPMWRGFRLVIRRGHETEMGALAVLMGAMLLCDVMVLPESSNVAGLWISLGLMARLTSSAVPIIESSTQPTVDERTRRVRRNTGPNLNRLKGEYS